MQTWNKENTVFIMVPTSYNTIGVKQEGLTVYRPYKDKSLFGRVIRELWFRVPFLSNRKWYNDAIISDNVKYILIKDPLITADYLVWLHEQLPDAQINFTYGNMVGKGKHLLPDQIPDFVRVWTYDDHDARKYHLSLFPYYIDREKMHAKKEPEFDVFFVGRDKGRGEWLLELEKQLQELGLKTKFIITRDGRFSEKKSYYQSEISYEQVLDYDSKSRAILNVTMKNQEGITMRDIEATALNIKLITTNKHIVDKDLYNPNNVFVLGERSISEIVDFVRSEPDPIPEDLIEKHSFKHRLDVITRTDYRDKE